MRIDCSDWLRIEYSKTSPVKPAKAVRPEKCFGAPVLEEGLCFVVGAGCFGF